MKGFCVCCCSTSGICARRSVTTMSPGFRPLFTSVSMPFVTPVSTGTALYVLPWRIHTLLLLWQSSMVSPSFSIISRGVKRRALEGTATTSIVSMVKMVTLAVRPGLSLRSSLGAEITTSYVTTLLSAVASWRTC